MDAYSYHPETGEYLGLDIVQENPRTPEFPLIPANSTLNQPPESGADQVAVFSDSSWSLQEDHRGKKAYKKSDCSEVTINEIGPLTDAYTHTKPEPFESWNGSEWVKDTKAELDHLYDTKLGAINAHAQQLVNPLLSKFPDFEQQTWPDQRNESQAWLAWNSSDKSTPEPETPTCTPMASGRGIDLKTFCEKVMMKANYFRLVSTSVASQRQKLEDQMDAIMADSEKNDDEKRAALTAIDETTITLPQPE